MVSRCALAWIDTNRSARARLAKLVRSGSGTKVSVSRVRSTLTPSRSSTSFAARRVTSSTSSFSRRPDGPTAPASVPPWPASSTIVRSGVTSSAGGPGSVGRAKSRTTRCGSASVIVRVVPAIPSKITRRSASPPARSRRTSSTKPSRISSTWACAARPINRIDASLGPRASMRYGRGPEVSTTTRVNDGYERKRSSSRATSAAAVLAPACAPTRDAPAASRGSTLATNDSGTSQTPRFPRTGASSTSGESFTRIRAQLRVKVMTCPATLSRARVLAGLASSAAPSRSAATRLSSTYGRPSWATLSRPPPASPRERSRSTTATAAKRPVRTVRPILATRPARAGALNSPHRRRIREGRRLGAYQGEHDEPEPHPHRLANPADQAERHRRGRAKAERGERHHVAALEGAEARRDEERREADRGAERLDHGGGRQRDGDSQEVQDEPGLDRAEQPRDQVEPDRQHEPPGGGPIEAREHVVDAPERLGVPVVEPELGDEPPTPREHAARLRDDEARERDRLDREKPEHPVQQRRARRGAGPGQRDAEQQEEALRDRDRGLRDDHRGHARVERDQASEEPRLDGLAAKRRRRRHEVEGLAGETDLEESAKGDAAAQEREPPPARVEHHDERHREAEDEREAPGELADRAEDRPGVVLRHEHGEQDHAQHEQRCTQVAQVSSPDRGGAGRPPSRARRTRASGQGASPATAAGARASGPSPRASRPGRAERA